MGYQGPCAAGLQVSLTRTSYFDDCAPMLVSHLAPYKGCRQACKRKLKNHKWAQMKRTRHIANRLRSLRHPARFFLHANDPCHGSRTIWMHLAKFGASRSGGIPLCTSGNRSTTFRYRLVIGMARYSSQQEYSGSRHRAVNIATAILFPSTPECDKDVC